MKAKMYQTQNGLIYRAEGNVIQVMNPQVNDEWRESAVMMDIARKSNLSMQEALDRKAAMSSWKPWEPPESAEEAQSNAVQLAAILADRYKRSGGEMTAEGFKKFLGTGGYGDPDLGDIEYDYKGVSIRPEPQRWTREMKFTWAKFIKFCRENGLIEEESIKCNTKFAQKPAAAANMAIPAAPPQAKTSTTSESTEAESSSLEPPPSSGTAIMSAPASPADAGAATQSLSAAAPASSEVRPLDSLAFDYTGLDQPTVDTLHLAERMIRDARRDYITKLAQAVYIVHDALCGSCDKLSQLKHGNRGEESFGAWCAYVGISRKTGERLLQVAALLNGSTPEEQAVLEAASPSLLYAAAKPSAPAQLVEGVKSGDITTHKQYQELLARLKATEEELASVQQEAALDRKEQEDANDAALRYKAEADRRAQDQQRLEGRIKTLESRAREAEKALADARQTAQDKAARIAELEARPVEVVGADPDEIERRANALAAEKTAALKVELAAEQARANQLAQRLDNVQDQADQSSRSFFVGLARRAADSCEDLLARQFADLARVDYDTYEQATDILRVLGDKLTYAIENGGWPDQWPIKYEEEPAE